ncbi:hypothetical protein R1flu_003317 [Riccia fluitans]|uniref:Uncharacterized protein n=1 Tax=Riccia fluitans TaxID=41844 RepID=A0ABD1Y8N4_9MARC
MWRTRKVCTLPGCLDQVRRSTLPRKNWIWLDKSATAAVDYAMSMAELGSGNKLQGGLWSATNAKGLPGRPTGIGCQAAERGGVHELGRYASMSDRSRIGGGSPSEGGGDRKGLLSTYGSKHGALSQDTAENTSEWGLR